jgi:hypothetical protein
VKVYKITTCVVDHDEIGSQGIVDAIEQTNYPNDCIMPSVVSVEEREVEWDDTHPLNYEKTAGEAFRQLFDVPLAVNQDDRLLVPLFQRVAELEAELARFQRYTDQRGKR